MKQTALNRRTFLQTGAVAAGVATVVESLAPGAVQIAQAASAETNPETATGTIARDSENIVETVYGKVRGFKRNGIHVFMGIPYGADTGGANRFLLARKPEPWVGTRSTLYYGHTCPALWNRTTDESMFIYQNDVGYMSEECLVVNVWTPGINDNRKRPVMVWMHGGGFMFGSSQELKAYDGEMLARSGDVVVVTFNHRLNAFGFLNLSEFGPDYATSGNLGMMDIVFLLEWVHDNISNFGGDPGNVTIMGQSGGGGKVGTIMAMPSAKGLFQRASIHSGSFLRANEPDDSLEIAHAMLKVLGVTPASSGKLHTLSWQELVTAAAELQRQRRSRINPGTLPDIRIEARAMGWGPYVDGTVIPKQLWDPEVPEFSADVPLMVGTVLNELVTGIDHPDAFSMTDAQLSKQLTDHYGALAQDLEEVFRKGHPKANPFQLWSIISTCSWRGNAVKQAQQKAKQGKASAYNFWFQWQSPMLSGRAMAFHCGDLPFFFNNVEQCSTMTGNGRDAQRLAQQISQTWIHFARTGNPSHSGIPEWKPVTASGNETMIFDSPNHFSEDPDSKERIVFEKIPT